MGLHHHHHGPADAHGGEKRTFWAMLFILLFMGAEIAGGILSGSLALLADAAHMATDAAALALAWFAIRLARRPRDETRTFGYHRVEVIAAFINGLALLPLTGWIVFEAIDRLGDPVPVMGLPMLLVAIGGLVANGVAFALLHGHGSDNLNIRAALLHVIGDILGSVAAIVAAVIIMLTGWTAIDPLLSLLVAGLILRSAWALVRQTTHILMEGAPSQIDPGEVASQLKAEVPEIRGIHDLHIWMLTENRLLLTMHVAVAAPKEAEVALTRAKEILRDSFGIHHSTIQVEANGCAD